MYILRITGFFGFIFSAIFFFQLSFYFLKRNDLIFFSLLLIFILIILYTFIPSFVFENILKRLGKRIEEKSLANIKGIAGTFLALLVTIYIIFAKFLLTESFSVQTNEIYGQEYANIEFSLQGKTLFLFHHINEYIRKDIDIGEEKIVPLSFPPSSYLLLCKNYDEGLVYYRTDRFGFRNKDEIWEKNPDVVVLGSYPVHGFCTYKPFLEKVAEDLKLNILNLGQGGADPLISLAIFKEFAYDLSPQAIFLFITQSDVSNISKSYQSDFLKLYLKEDDFRQGLKQTLRMTEVQFKIEREFYNYEREKRKEEIENEREKKRREIAKKDNIIEKLFLFFKTPEFINFAKKRFEKPKKISDLDIMVLALVLKEFRSISRKIRAKFIVVYIPEEIEITKGFFSNYRGIKRLVEKLDIKFYDLTKKIDYQEKSEEEKEKQGEKKQKETSIIQGILRGNYHIPLAKEFTEIIQEENIITKNEN